MKTLRLLYSALLVAVGHTVVWAAAPRDSTKQTHNSYYKLGKQAGRIIEHYNVNLLASTLLVMALVLVLSKLLDLPRRLPRWHRWLRRLWVPAVLGFVATAALGYVSKQLVSWYLLFSFGVLAAMLLRLRPYRPAATALWALLPLALHRLLAIGMGVAGYRWVAPFDNYFKTWGGINLLWASVLLALAFAQKRNEQNAEVRRAAAEQTRQQAAARNAELERLVAERTATLTQQSNELQTALAELRTTQQQLIQSEKMASLGELTAGIAHEIQNPLNFVNNFADVSAELVAELETEQASPQRDAGLEDELLADLKHNLHKINLHGQRASSIVRGMLAHSRQSTGERQPTDVNALADEYLRLAYHGLRAKDKTFNATLDTDLAPILPLVEAVPGDLGRVLLNLLTNAFYAVQKRQQAGEAGYQPTVRVATRRCGDSIEVCVRDNGLGMSPEVQAKIFQPFFTTKPSGQGTGLGLSLSHDIVVQGHGGTLEVSSQENEFTEFVVRLPFRAST